MCALLLGQSGPLAAQERPTCRDDAIIVFDASGSMLERTEDGRTRIEIARAAAREVVPVAANARNLGLVIYGPGARGRCQKYELNVAPQPDAAGKIISAIDATRPYGETPLTSAVEAAANALDFTRKPAVVVLLTDGNENCGRYPCALAHQLRDKAHRLTIHVIGFRLNPRAFRAFACVTRETGGILRPASTQEQLVEALRETLTCPQITHAAPRLRGSIGRSTSR